MTQHQTSVPINIRKNGYNYDVDLGNMHQAIVIGWEKYFPFKEQAEGYYIKIQSFFPFTDEQRKVRYNSAEECLNEAFKIVRDWMQSVLNYDGNFNVENKLKRLS